MTLGEGAIIADRFQLVGELGRGGMGSVWRAHHLPLDIPCAVKFIHDHGLDAQGRARFESEARAAAKLRCSSVVQVFDYGVFESTPYIAMELLDGETLADRLERETHLGLVAAYDVARQVGWALTKAEQLSIVHRDLKPENVFVAREGDREIVKVLDFGVAKFTNAQRDPAVATRTGAVIGTPNYLSPEQAHGAKEVDHRSDLYALALIVFECVTGRLAFEADGLGELLTKIMRGKLPKPTFVRSTLPVAIDAWFAKAAALDPDDRYDSAAAMLDALQAIVAAHVPHSSSSPLASSPLASSQLAPISSRPYANTEAPADEGDATSSRRVPARAASQEIGFCRAGDGVRLAYARYGTGAPLVKVANWLSHLELDWGSPIWDHWLDYLCSRWSLVRYDARGNGLSQWQVEHIDFEHFVGDLERVIDASKIERAPLLGISQGAAVAAAYAARYPERVSSLILIGGCARGWRTKGHARLTEQFEALATLMRNGWGQDSPLFRQIFTDAFFPTASAGETAFFNELQRRTTTPENASRILDALGDVDVRAELSQVKVPTLVLHSRGDQIVPISDGMELAAGIEGARFVSIDSSNHMLLSHEPGWQRVCAEIDRFADSLTPS